MHAFFPTQNGPATPCPAFGRIFEWLGGERRHHNKPSPPASRQNGWLQGEPRGGECRQYPPQPESLPPEERADREMFGQYRHGTPFPQWQA